jgi:hypothetical protein
VEHDDKEIEHGDVEIWNDVEAVGNGAEEIGNGAEEIGNGVEEFGNGVEEIENDIHMTHDIHCPLFAGMERKNVVVYALDLSHRLFLMRTIHDPVKPHSMAPVPPVL